MWKLWNNLTYTLVLCRVTVIKNDNERLSEEIRQLRAVRLERERRAKEIAEPPVREIKRDRRHIPGNWLIFLLLSKIYNNIASK